MINNRRFPFKPGYFSCYGITEKKKQSQKWEGPIKEDEEIKGPIKNRENTLIKNNGFLVIIITLLLV